MEVECSVKTRIGKELKNPKTNKPSKFGWKKEFRTSKEPNLLHFSSFNGIKPVGKLSPLEKNMHQRVDNEAERKRCSGMLYANITRIR